MVKGSNTGAGVANMDGKVVLITGATRGIGRKVVHGMAPSGATMIVVGRDQSRIDEVISEAKAIDGCGPISGEVCNLLEQDEIRALAERVKSQHSQLDVLVNNAGAIFTKNIKTSAGFERTWALNHNAYFLLTSLLKDQLISSSAARVISTASEAHRPGKMRWNDLQYDKRRSMGGWSTYCQSKLANILFTKELARKLAGTDVTANCIHPGFVNTGFSRNNGVIGRMLMFLSWPFQRRDSKGAETIVWLATSEASRKHNGEYLYNCRPGKLSKAAKRDEDAAKLWGLSEQMTNTSDLW